MGQRVFGLCRAVNGSNALEPIFAYVRAGRGLNLFLDYDGTLVPIGRGPDDLHVEPALLALLTALARCPLTPTTVLSARPLAALETLFAIPELNLAGIYGLEIRLNGERLTRGAPLSRVRPTLEQLQARSAAAGWLYLKDFLLLGGDDYLEVAPGGANKGQAVTWLLNHTRRPNLLPVVFGDDDNDDQAFAVVQRHGGFAVGVGDRFTLPHATARVESPQMVRQSLQGLLAEAQRSAASG